MTERQGEGVSAGCENETASTVLVDSSTITAHREPIFQHILFSVILKAAGYKHHGGSKRERCSWGKQGGVGECP